MLAVCSERNRPFGANLALVPRVFLKDASVPSERNPYCRPPEAAIASRPLGCTVTCPAGKARLLIPENVARVVFT
jgi:hypothetical protein